RTQTALPLCVGFGVSRPEHVAMLREHVDGVIVGSALVRRIEGGGDAAGRLAELSRSLAAALDPAGGDRGASPPSSVILCGATFTGPPPPRSGEARSGSRRSTRSPFLSSLPRCFTATHALTSPSPQPARPTCSTASTSGNTGWPRPTGSTFWTSSPRTMT